MMSRWLAPLLLLACTAAPANKPTPEQVKRDMLQNAIQATGTSGTIEQDDADVWPVIMRSR